MTEIISTGYTPRPVQEQMHRDLRRFNVIVAHRRLGKTVFSINEIIDQALRCTRKSPRYAYISPTYSQSKRVAWDMLKDFTKNLPGMYTNEQALTVAIPRPEFKDEIKITLLGGDNPDSIRGIYLDGAVLDEVAQIDPRVWSEVVRPALSDRMGWAVFIGTPYGANAFKKLYDHAKDPANKNWYGVIHKASVTGIIPEEELADMKAEMPPEEFSQEFECSFTAALKGSYWGSIIEDIEDKGQVSKVPHDPALQVDTAWDIGISDMMTIWFVQQTGLEVRIIDYYEMSGMGLDHYARILKEGHRSKYNYRDHNFPHDMSARELSSGKSRSQVMRDLGVRVYVRPKYDVYDSINAARLLLPKCYFDVEKCAKGIEGLKAYERVWDGKNQVYQERPKHNYASHPADAFRLLAMCLKPGEDRLNRKKMQRYADTKWNIFG